MGHGLRKVFAIAKGKTYRQAAVWIPRRGDGGPAPTVAVPEKPERVWTLLYDGKEGEPPHWLSGTPKTPGTTLRDGPPGLLPQHRVNAFLEDPSHDWTWRDGVLRYFSRLNDGGCWILLEYGVS